MNRIEKIHAYKKRMDEAANKRVEGEALESKYLKLRIRNLRPRITELIATANACFENGIDIDTYGDRYDRWFDTYENGTFVTNSISHRVGFVQNWKNHTSLECRRIAEVGINAGGACGSFDFRTDGVSIYSADERGVEYGKEEPRLEHMKRFIEQFDEFEKAFYEYVDNIVNK